MEVGEEGTQGTTGPAPHLTQLCESVPAHELQIAKVNQDFKESTRLSNSFVSHMLGSCYLLSDPYD